MDHQQGVFCVSSLSAKKRKLDLSDLNLICIDDWYDLMNAEPFPDLINSITDWPYQTLWLSNRVDCP